MTNDYPTEEQLDRVRNWKGDDLIGLMNYLGDENNGIWHWPDWGVQMNDDGSWSLHTGGWSGNEEIIGAMMDNTVWWMMWWHQSRRGGHYTFKKM